MAKQAQRQKGSLLRQLTIYVGVVAIIYLATVFLIMPLYTRHWQRNQVPDVTFLSATAAEKVISKAGLVPLLGETKYDNTVPPGYVIFQNPLAHAFVKDGRRVYLVMSKGKQPVTVPGLVGVNLRDARFVLMQRQLEIGEITYDFDTYFPEDVIMEQSVEEDKELSAGSEIDLIVSLGEEPRQVYIPNLIGKPLADAELLIKKACLTKGTVSFRPGENADLPRVLVQSLQPGLEAAKGDTIDIVVNVLARGQEGKIPW